MCNYLESIKSRLNGKLVNLITGSEIELSTNTDFSSDVLSEAGLYQANLNVNETYLSDDVYGDNISFTFNFQLISEGTAPGPQINQENLGIFMSNDNFINSKPVYYGITFSSAFKGYVTLAFATEKEAFDYAYEYMKGMVEIQPDGSFRYDGDISLSQKIKYESLFFIALFKLRDTINPTIGWFIYLFSFYNMSLNITRQCISMSLIILGITYLLNEKQSWKFWALFTIALLFHRTAILALIVYGIFKLTNRYRISDNKALYSMLFIIVALSVYSIFTYTNIITLLGDQREIYSSYLNGEEGSVSKSSFIFYATVALLLLLSRRGVENKILDFFFVVSLFSLFIIMATTVNQVFSRLGIYFTSMECISMAYILNNKNVQRGIVNSTVQGWKKYALILFVIGMWYFSVVYHNSNMTYPYVSSLIF